MFGNSIPFMADEDIFIARVMKPLLWMHDRHRSQALFILKSMLQFAKAVNWEGGIDILIASFTDPARLRAELEDARFDKVHIDIRKTAIDVLEGLCTLDPENNLQFTANRIYELFRYPLLMFQRGDKPIFEGVASNGFDELDSISHRHVMLLVDGVFQDERFDGVLEVVAHLNDGVRPIILLGEASKLKEKLHTANIVDVVQLFAKYDLADLISCHPDAVLVAGDIESDALAQEAKKLFENPTGVHFKSFSFIASTCEYSYKEFGSMAYINRGYCRLFASTYGESRVTISANPMII